MPLIYDTFSQTATASAPQLIILPTDLGKTSADALPSTLAKLSERP